MTNSSKNRCSTRQISNKLVKSETLETCRATTESGKQCKRHAKIILNLNKQRTLLGYQLPKFNCCFFCSQHAVLSLLVPVAKLTMFLATKDLSWDEYIAVDPGYMDQVLKHFET